MKTAAQAVVSGPSCRASRAADPNESSRDWAQTPGSLLQPVGWRNLTSP